MAENPKISKTSGKYFFTGPGCWTIALGTSIFSPPQNHRGRVSLAENNLKSKWLANVIFNNIIGQQK